MDLCRETQVLSRFTIECIIVFENYASKVGMKWELFLWL